MKLLSKFRCQTEIIIKTERLSCPGDISQEVSDRQKLLPAFDQQALERTSVILIGAGGIGSELAEGAVRKGIGGLLIYDHDTVDLSNLNRQHFFIRDIGSRKGVCLAKNISLHATCGTIIEGYGYSFQDAVALGHKLDADIVICGVDNNQARVEVSRFFRVKKIPVIFIAVDYMAECGYVFIQENEKACFGCLFPNCLEKRNAPCRTPAVKDVLKVVAGLGLYAVDSLIMPRKRNWNFRKIHLAGFAPDVKMVIERKNECPLCR